MPQSIIEFGTSKIVCASGIKQDGEIDVTGFSSRKFAGIKKSKWIDPSGIADIVEELISDVEKEQRRTIKSIVVGIPACFTKVISATGKVDIENGVVSENDIKRLKAECAPYTQDKWVIIDERAAWYADDRGNSYIQSPISKNADRLSACISYTFAYEPFVRDVKSLMGDMRIDVSDIVPQTLAQALFFIPESVRDEAAVLIDVGYYDTTVSLVFGDAIVREEIIHAGGAQIAGDISKVLDTDMVLAENLKRTYVYGMDCSEGMLVYAKDRDRKMCGFPESDVKAVIDARTEHLADMMRTKISSFGKYIGKDTPVYLTGGGLLLQKGSVQIMEKELGRKVVGTKSVNIKLNTPVFFTALSLLDNALNRVYSLDDSEKKQSVFGKLRKSVFLKK